MKIIYTVPSTIISILLAVPLISQSNIFVSSMQKYLVNIHKINNMRVNVNLVIVVLAVSILSYGFVASSAQTTFDCPNDEIVTFGGERVCAFDRSEAPSKQVSEDLTVKADQSVYVAGNTIVVSGTVNNIEDNYPVPVTIIIKDPDGVPSGITQLTHDSDGNFTKSFKTFGQFWETKGTYQIITRYGDYERVISFDFSDESSTTSSLANGVSILDDKQITYSTDDKQVDLVFSDQRISGHIQLDGTRITLEDNPIIKEKNNRLFIIDKANNIKILLKSISENKYLVLVKLKADSQELRAKFIANTGGDNTSAPTTQPRDLRTEIQERQRLAEENERNNEQQLRGFPLKITQEDLDEAEARLQQQLDQTIQKNQKNSGGITQEDILKEVEKYKRQNAKKTTESTTNQIDTKATTTKPTDTKATTTTTNQTDTKATTTKPTLSTDKKIKSFISMPIHIRWGDELRSEILVTDDARRDYDTTFNAFIGKRIADAIVSGAIKDPSGKTLHTFKGNTSQDGTYLDSFVIPSNSITRGEYSMVTNATNYYDDNTFAMHNTSKIFFVNPLEGSFNSPPVANITNSTFPANLGYVGEQILNGSASSDLEGGPITFSWQQIAGANVAFTSDLDTSIVSFHILNTTMPELFMERDVIILRESETINMTNTIVNFTHVTHFAGNPITESSLPNPIIINDANNNVAIQFANETDVPQSLLDDEAVSKTGLQLTMHAGKVDTTNTNIDRDKHILTIVDSTLIVQNTLWDLKDQDLRFRLTVSDGTKSHTERVTIPFLFENLNIG